MKFLLVRHEKTFGNVERRYVGTTDEILTAESIKRLHSSEYKDYKPDAVFVSPMRRCIQTANILYPDVKLYIIEDDFRETDFGDFEYKNYEELKDNADYQAWIDSMGMMPFPNGEAPEEFRERCCKAFEKCLKIVNFEDKEDPLVVIVAHGGTIMAILEKYEARHDFYHWQIEPGKAILADWKDGELIVEE